MAPAEKRARSPTPPTDSDATEIVDRGHPTTRPKKRGRKTEELDPELKCTVCQKPIPIIDGRQLRHKHSEQEGLWTCRSCYDKKPKPGRKCCDCGTTTASYWNIKKSADPTQENLWMCRRCYSKMPKKKCCDCSTTSSSSWHRKQGEHPEQENTWMCKPCWNKMPKSGKICCECGITTSASWRRKPSDQTEQGNHTEQEDLWLCISCWNKTPKPGKTCFDCGITSALKWLRKKGGSEKEYVCGKCYGKVHKAPQRTMICVDCEATIIPPSKWFYKKGRVEEGIICSKCYNEPPAAEEARRCAECNTPIVPPLRSYNKGRTEEGIVVCSNCYVGGIKQCVECEAMIIPPSAGYRRKGSLEGALVCSKCYDVELPEVMVTVPAGVARPASDKKQPTPSKVCVQCSRSTSVKWHKSKGVGTRDMAEHAEVVGETSNEYLCYTCYSEEASRERKEQGAQRTARRSRPQRPSHLLEFPPQETVPSDCRDRQSIASVYESREAEELHKVTSAIRALTYRGMMVLRVPSEKLAALNVGNLSAVEAPAAIQRAQQEVPFQALAAILNKPPKADRDYVFELGTYQTKSGKQWFRFGVRQPARLPSAGAVVHSAQGAAKSKYRCIGTTPATSYDAATAERIGQKATELLIRWPGTIDSISQRYISSGRAMLGPPVGQMMLACLERIELRAMAGRLRLDSPAREGRAWKLTAAMVDPDTAQFYKGTCILPDILAPSVDFSMPPNLEFRKGSSHDVYKVIPTHGGKNEDHESGLPDDEDLTDAQRRNALQAEKTLRCIAAHVFRTVFVRPSDFEVFCKSWVNAYTQRARLKSPLFICVVDKPRGSVRLEPKTAILERLSGKLPTLRISSRNVSRILMVCDAINQTFHAQGDIKLAWLAGAEAQQAAQQAIVNGDLPVNQCQCDSADSQVTMHYCGSCCASDFCVFMHKSIFAFKICRACYKKEQLDKDQLMGKILHHLVGHDDRDGAVDHLRTFLTDEALPGGSNQVTWLDYLSSSRRRFVGEAPRHDPSHPSVDSAFPYDRTSHGTIHDHATANLRLTTLAINFAKHVHLPGVLQVIKEYVMQVQTMTLPQDAPVPTRGEFDQLKTRLTQQVANFRKLRMKTPYTRASRRMLDPSDDYLVAVRRQWISGKLFEADKAFTAPWNKVSFLNRFVSKELPATAKPRMEALFKQLEAEFDITLIKAPDGCPIICHPEASPEWSWDVSYAFFTDRLDRMTHSCNQYDQTLDTALTLFIECVFQICVTQWEDPKEKTQDTTKLYTREDKVAMKRKYSNSLHLPMVLDMFDPLCMAVAHYWHGMRMFSGWPSDAENLADRREDQNNLIFEPRIVNFLKASFAHNQHDTLRQLVLDINVPKEFYDPDLDLQAFDMPPGFEDSVTKEDVIAGMETHLTASTSQPFLDMDNDDDVDTEDDGFDFGDGGHGATEDDQQILYDEFLAVQMEFIEKWGEVSNVPKAEHVFDYLREAAEQEDHEAFKMRREELRKLEEHASEQRRSRTHDSASSSTSADQVHGARGASYYRTLRESVINTPRMVAEFFNLGTVAKRNGCYYIENKEGETAGAAFADVCVFVQDRALFFNTDGDGRTHDGRSSSHASSKASGAVRTEGEEEGRDGVIGQASGAEEQDEDGMEM
ncbi:hypothetical protein FB567DRAFT_544381 [Paraphoma chrysanthemicola]|uniref:Uncharacterized protein n=1 Tax=Paraphoma chrysanthemicola TaxID=798071 RepID=A0A8K0W314_9PLEO|nr:hypothetical protein FB567DRAFT_544381 [Paraphoma chrysanthemicola]